MCIRDSLHSASFVEISVSSSVKVPISSTVGLGGPRIQTGPPSEGSEVRRTPWAHRKKTWWARDPNWASQ
eukprot:4979363-Alexandrium_andersonii.AAC.1